MKSKLYFHNLKRKSKFNYANNVPMFIHNIHEYSYHILVKSLKTAILGLFLPYESITKMAQTIIYQGFQAFMHKICINIHKIKV